VLNRVDMTVHNRSNQKRLTALEKKYGVKSAQTLEELLKNPDVVILAVKPKDVLEVLESIQPLITKDMLFISVAAGITISLIENRLGRKIPIVRAMPNTSARIGQSATGMAFNEAVTKVHQKKALDIFQAIGLTISVEEKQLDAVTGLSGSGPAYIYYIAEALQQSAEEIGLEGHAAKNLVIQTIIGAAEMLKQSSETPEALRKAVTSPNGTTEAGIRILDKSGVKQAFIDCVKEAAKRSKELSRIQDEISVAE
jgi:pyrroline-5-carboxylate reductase